jgi:hypothetical protein
MKKNIPISHQQELDRRLDEYERGETEFVTWDDVKRKLESLTPVEINFLNKTVKSPKIKR